MLPDPSSGYDTRLQRFNDTVNLKASGNALFIPNAVHFFPAKLAGVTNAAVMDDHKLRYQCLKDMILRYDLDMAVPDGLYNGSGAWNLLQSKQWAKPGHELDDDRPFQFIEQEHMLADEYDHFLRDPSDFTMRVIWPRISGALEPFGLMPPLHYYLNYPIYMTPFFAFPNFIEMLETLKKAGEEWASYNEAYTGFVEDMKTASYPLLYMGVGFPPFDVLSVYLRGLKGSMLDMRRRPDKVLAALDLLAERQIGLLKLQAELSGCPRVTIFCYRGADVFMSNEEFGKFYWPSLLKVVNELVDAGITPTVFFEIDVTSRLPFFTDLPKGKVPIHYEAIDRRKAREVVGELNAFWGNISASLMTLGTPAEVKADVRELIELFGDTNGLIIDGALQVPDETRPENLEAIIEAIDEYS